jgi:hypothetical protein
VSVLTGIAQGCKHKQCSLCLGRECNVGKVQHFGDLAACDLCISKAVAWAHLSACRWGGTYLYRGGEKCGQQKAGGELAPRQLGAVKEDFQIS